MMTKNADKKRDQLQMFCMDDMVPNDHLLRLIDKAIDWDFIYDLVKDTYSQVWGRPSIDPVMLIKIPLIQYLYGIKSIANRFFMSPSSVILMSALEQGICEIWSDDNTNPQNIVAFTELSAYVDGSIVQEDVINSIYDWMKKHKKERYQIVFQNGVVKDSINQAFAKSKMGTEYTYEKTKRNLMDIDMYVLDTIKLESFINEFPAEYQVLEINEELYEKALNDKYLAQFVHGFSNAVDFINNGLGYFVLFHEEIVGGISSCARYKDNVEVQIAIHPSHRGKHLARSIGAKFVLECQKRKLYPWWDCANPTSEHIAKSLGYFLKQENCTYKMQIKYVEVEL